MPKGLMRLGFGASMGLAYAFLASAPTAAASAVDSVPPPPEPPPPPPGVAEAYYSTCGGSHPPVQYVVSKVSPTDPRYKEVERYASSPAYRQYEQDLAEYKKKYGKEYGTYGEVDSKTGRQVERGRIEREETPPPAEPESSDPPVDPGLKVADPASETPTPTQGMPDTGSGSTPPEAGPALRNGPDSFFGFQTGVNGLSGKLESMQAIALARNPKQDLSRWFRGFLYHEEVQSITYDDAPEENTSLRVADAGPAASSSLYGRLVTMLELPGGTNPPAPNELLASLDQMWKEHWRPKLGFNADSSSRLLLGDLQRTQRNVETFQAKLNELAKQSADEKSVQVRLVDQIQFNRQELAKAQAQAAAMRTVIQRRLEFVEAIVALVRLAPEGGFGPTFLEADLEAVQSAAVRIAGDIGPLAAREIWAGLAADLLWIESRAQGASCAEFDRTRRILSADAAEKLLRDPRVEGREAVRDFLLEVKDPPPVVLRKALELFEFLGARQLNAEALAALPTLIRHSAHPDGTVAERARLALTRVLGLREGKASLEDAIADLAPVLKGKDEGLTAAAVEFLEFHTGQKYGRNAAKWLQLKKRMEAERKKLEKAAK